MKQVYVVCILPQGNYPGLNNTVMHINAPCGLVLMNDAQLRLHKKVCVTCASLPSYKAIHDDLKLQNKEQIKALKKSGTFAKSHLKCLDY